MRRLATTALASAALATGLVVSGISPALAVTDDAYSNGQPPPGDVLPTEEPTSPTEEPTSPTDEGEVLNEEQTRDDDDSDDSDSTTSGSGGVSDDSDSLPVTGGELVLALTLGGAAVGAGTLLVVAGRKRATTTS